MLKAVADELTDRGLIASPSHLDLNLLMMFIEVVGAGSISRAAVRLGMPKATLSRKWRPRASASPCSRTPCASPK